MAQISKKLVYFLQINLKKIIFIIYLHGKNWFVNIKNLNCGGVLEDIVLFWALKMIIIKTKI